MSRFSLCPARGALHLLGKARHQRPEQVPVVMGLGFQVRGITPGLPAAAITVSSGAGGGRMGEEVPLLHEVGRARGGPVRQRHLAPGPPGCCLCHATCVLVCVLK